MVNRLTLTMLVMIMLTQVTTPVEAASEGTGTNSLEALSGINLEPQSWVADKNTKKAYKVGRKADIAPLGSVNAFGFDPSTVKDIYKFPTYDTAGIIVGTGQTVAIVAAFHNPKAESDLNAFSTAYGLPACTKLSDCFKQVYSDQYGNVISAAPVFNEGWAMEMSLDVQWAHAIAPGANILLVEAKDSNAGNLLGAVKYASKNAKYVSNSWGGNEFSFETWYDSWFATTSVSYFVASGDGAKPFWPSVSPNVVAVGGTSLKNIGAPDFSETGWVSSGGGCSAYEKANASQSSYFAIFKNEDQCLGKRATPDLSLNADPASGVSVYNSNKYLDYLGGPGVVGGEVGPWYKLGGTSASTPMVAGRAAATEGQVQVNAAYVYNTTTPRISYRDIVEGSSSYTSGTTTITKFCKAGFDLVTGRGSWLN